MNFSETATEFINHFRTNQEWYESFIDDKQSSFVVEDIISSFPLFKELFSVAIRVGIDNDYEIIFGAKGHVINSMLCLYLKVLYDKEEFENWKFYSSIPPITDPDEFVYELGSEEITFNDVYVNIKVIDKFKIELEMFCKSLKDDDEGMNIALLLLEKAIGELFVTTLVSKVVIVSSHLDNGFMKLDNAHEFIVKLMEDNELNPVNSILDLVSIYNIENPKDEEGFRNDIYTGVVITADPYLMIAKDRNKAEDLSRKIGMNLGFVTVEIANIDKEAVLELHQYILALVSEYTLLNGVAIIFGSAIGLNHLYFDFFVFDKELFIEVIQSVLEKLEEIPKFYCDFLADVCEPI